VCACGVRLPGTPPKKSAGRRRTGVAISATRFLRQQYIRATNGEMVSTVLLVAHEQPLKNIPWETDEIKKLG